MSEWKGLHNPERHTPYAVNGDPATAWCRCDAWIVCTPDDPCKCCLAAEVETLRADNADLSLHLKAAWAQVQRVRDVCDRIWDDARYAHKYGFLEVVREVRYALDGDGEDVLVTNAIAAMMDGPLIDPSDCRDGKHSSCVGGPCECVCHELAALDGESDG